MRIFITLILKTLIDTGLIHLISIIVRNSFYVDLEWTWFQSFSLAIIVLLANLVLGRVVIKND